MKKLPGSGVSVEEFCTKERREAYGTDASGKRSFQEGHKTGMGQVPEPIGAELVDVLLAKVNKYSGQVILLSEAWVGVAWPPLLTPDNGGLASYRRL